MQAKKPGVDAGDSIDEAEDEAGMDPSHILVQVDLEVRIKQKRHNIRLKELPRVPYDDPDQYLTNTTRRPPQAVRVTVRVTLQAQARMRHQMLGHGSHRALLRAKPKRLWSR